MFQHTHPYEPFLFPEVTKLIVGTLPPPRFTTKELKPGDVNFCYGSRDGQLWPILDQIFKLNLEYKTSIEAINQRKAFLRSRNIGICDIVASAKRLKVDASDLGMIDVKLRNLIDYLHKYTLVDTLLFTGGNSKNGPEYFFRKLLKSKGLNLEVLCNKLPRIHQFEIGIGDVKRKIKTVSLIAPSGSANRAIGSLESYKKSKEKDPSYTTIDFRIAQYKNFF